MNKFIMFLLSGSNFRKRIEEDFEEQSDEMQLVR